VTPEERGREAGIRQFYELKLQQLTAQMQSAYDKANKFYKERQSTLEQLVATADERDALTEKKETLERERDKMVDELSTTRSNYDMQIAMLTEHIVQKDGELRQVLGCKIKCKKCSNDNTLEYLLSDRSKGGTKCAVKGCRIDYFFEK
jgi:hypothetical protein